MIESDSEGSGDEDDRNLVTQASKRKRCEVTAWYSFALLGCIGLYDMKVCMDGTRAGTCMFMFMTSCGCLHRGQRLLITT